MLRQGLGLWLVRSHEKRLVRTCEQCGLTRVDVSIDDGETVIFTWIPSSWRERVQSGGPKGDFQAGRDSNCSDFASLEKLKSGANDNEGLPANPSPSLPTSISSPPDQKLCSGIPQVPQGPPRAPAVVNLNGNSGTKPNTGTGDYPLLLLHGFGGSAIWQWGFQLPALSKRFHVIMPDLVFFGESRSSSAQRTDAWQAECMAKALQKMGVERCHVMGISYGGLVAYKLATQFPHLVSKLVLVSAGVVYSQPDYQSFLERLNISHPADLLLPTQPSGVLRLMRVVHARTLFVPRCILEGALEVLFMDGISEKRAMLDALVEQAADGKQPERLAEGLAVLLVWGNCDKLFPPELGRRTNEFLGSKSRFELFPRCGHVPTMQRAKKFNSVVIKFLQEQYY